MASKQASKRNPGLKAITVRIPNILAVRVKVHAARRKMTVQELTAIALSTYLGATP